MVVELTTRDELKELKKDRTYNSYLLILLQRNKILKKIINENSDLRDTLKRRYSELFIDPELLY